MSIFHIFVPLKRKVTYKYVDFSIFFGVTIDDNKNGPGPSRKVPRPGLLPPRPILLHVLHRPYRMENSYVSARIYSWREAT